MSEGNDYEAIYLEELVECLKGMQLPPLKDRSATARVSAKDRKTRVTAVILSSPSSQIAALLEGARQQREAVFLVLNPLWLERVDDDLYLKKGIWMSFDTSQVYLDQYNPPRRVTYFANFFTKISTFGRHDEGEHLSKGLNCPMSLVNEIEFNDKIWMKAVLARAMISFPKTLAFSYKSKRDYHVPQGSNLAVKKISDLNEGSIAIIEKNLRSFQKGMLKKNVKTLVVKRGGPTRANGVTLSYHDIDNLSSCLRTIVSMLKDTVDGDSVCVEEFLDTLPSHKVVPERLVPMQNSQSVVVQNGPDLITHLMDLMEDDKDSWDDNHLDSINQNPMAFTVRVTSTLSPSGVPLGGCETCFVQPKDKIPTHSIILPITLEQVLRQWGFNEERDIKRIQGVLRGEAERVHKVLINEVGQLEGKANGDGQVDLISVDFILALKGSLVMPFVIRVHDHDTLIIPQRLDECLGRRGHCARPWVNRMLSRSQNKVLQGRCVLIVGGGGFGKLEQWDLMDQLGLKLVLADPNPEHIVKHRVWKFLHVPSLTNHSQDGENADLIVEMLKKEGIADQVHGVTTTYDPCVVVASHVARLLGLHGNDPEAHELAKNKLALAKFLKKCPPFSRYHSAPSLFVAESVKITSAEDIKKALSGKDQVMSLPAVLKNSHGMCGMGVKLVNSVEEAVEEYEKMEVDLKRDLDSDWTGLSFGGETFLMEYLDGTEHDVDIVMFQGELVAAMVTDNGPTRLPYFNETCAAMPSRRSKNEVAALIAGAHVCARAANLHTGVYNVEMKYTSQGPRLIEINARLGGFYLINWAQRVFDVNLIRFPLFSLFSSFLSLLFLFSFLFSFYHSLLFSNSLSIRCVVQVACGIRPIIKSARAEAKKYCVGLQLYNSQHGKGLRPLVPKDESILTAEERVKQNRLRMLDQEGVIVWIPMAAGLKDEAMEWEGAYANIGCEANSHEEAAAKLLSVVRCLHLDQDAQLKTDYYINGLGIKVEAKLVIPVVPLS